MNIPYYLNEKTGLAMVSGSALNFNYTGSYKKIIGDVSGGWGQVYGIFWDSGNNASVGFSLHTTGIKTPPSPTGTIYYPRPDPFGSEVKLYFFITAMSGINNGTELTTTGAGVYRYLLTGTGVSGLNCEYYSAGKVLYNGPSGVFRPSGRLLHKESYAILPNYAVPAWQAARNVSGYDYSYSPFVGGIYPSMLNDNIIDIDLEITWSGDCGSTLIDNC